MICFGTAGVILNGIRSRAQLARELTPVTLRELSAAFGLTLRTACTT